ncbi:MAG: hypothetical protein Sapg2KO_34370 [Saprospiraceae bacterium]
MDIQTILKSDDVHIIDVREPYEFMTERLYEATNMPLSRFQDFIKDIKKMSGKKIFYCQSGNRSGQAVAYLKSIGIQEVYNGGSLYLMKSYLLPK